MSSFLPGCMYKYDFLQCLHVNQSSPSAQLRMYKTVFQVCNGSDECKSLPSAGNKIENVKYIEHRVNKADRYSLKS